ncbi:MAG: hypothetical protein FJ197_09075 [Gammaproteobacteria bacterium]|nr:hypothetical protein [Gammaproteobacteria bacterium]
MTEKQIPVLTDIVLQPADPDLPAHFSITDEELRELQDRISTEGYALMERLLHEALREMEANLFADVIGRLRAELPSMIDDVVSEHLSELRARDTERR